jgi:hypothetical protein
VEPVDPVRQPPVLWTKPRGIDPQADAWLAEASRQTPSTFAYIARASVVRASRSFLPSDQRPKNSVDSPEDQVKLCPGHSSDRLMAVMENWEPDD